MTAAQCRLCGTALHVTFCDLGMSPPSNAFLTAQQLERAEQFLPLHAYVCEQCFLVQLPEHEAPERIFSDYVYFSSFSDTWLAHAKRYVDQISDRLCLNGQSKVVEIASNDGYLLQYFVEKGVPVLGIEPAANVAEVARAKGIRTVVEFFGTALARELLRQGEQADLLIGNNVLAHVPNLNDFVAGLALALASRGTITMEFPHLLRLMAENQFDTIYHEHFSYLSLLSVEQAFKRHGLTIHDVEELSTHGGSLRIHASHARAAMPKAAAVDELRTRERAAGLDRIDTYRSFEENVRRTKRRLLEFLVRAKDEGKTVAGYGAAAKGNTLLNYCGVREDFIDYVVDRSPHKQGLFLPGTHIPVHAPQRIFETRPDYVLILPWNIRQEVMEQMAGIRDWGGRFVVPIPSVQVLA